MNLKTTTLVMLILLAVACSPNKSNPENWTDEQVNSWFEKQEWLAGWPVAPHPFINKRTFAVQYHKNPRHWDQAFHFLKTADLKNLPEGKQELEGKHLFVSVANYFGKAKPDALYESHKNYIDIQYVAEGEELIGLSTLDKMKIRDAYDTEKDIAFYDFDGGEYLKATPDNFFLFFPEDMHRPSISTGDSIPIKKIVVKILIESE